MSERPATNQSERESHYNGRPRERPVDGSVTSKPRRSAWTQKPLIAVALLWFSQISVGGGFTTDILGPSLLAAAGLGFAFVTTTIAAVSGVREQESGLASGLINTSQQIGGALGLAVLVTIANSRTEDLISPDWFSRECRAVFGEKEAIEVLVSDGTA